MAAMGGWMQIWRPFFSRRTHDWKTMVVKKEKGSVGALKQQYGGLVACAKWRENAIRDERKTGAKHLSDGWRLFSR